METEVVVALIVLAQAVGVAVINGIMKRREESNAEYRQQREIREKERDKAADEREAARLKRDTCFYDLMFATAEGTEVLLHKAHGDHMNGNVEEALAAIQKAKSECNHFVNHQAAKL